SSTKTWISQVGSSRCTTRAAHPPSKPETEFQNLEKARAIRPDNVVQAQAPADPQQGWLVKEQVLPTTTPPDMAQRAQVRQDFLSQIPDSGGNLMWGTTAGNPTPRWLLIE